VCTTSCLRRCGGSASECGQCVQKLHHMPQGRHEAPWGARNLYTGGGAGTSLTGPGMKVTFSLSIIQIATALAYSPSS
jgi:hypothetical protein